MARKLTNDDKLLMLWSLGKYNNALDDYRKLLRDYCLCRAEWSAVEEARRSAHFCGVGDETLLEIDLDVMESITDEELHEAVYGA